MPVWVWVVLALLVLAIVAVGSWAVWRRQRTERLRGTFGPEYDRTVTERGTRDAEAELIARRRRRSELDIHPLTGDARRRYEEQWQDVQARFVDQPVESVAEADALVIQVMRERGYPIDEFDQRAADVSVDHPQVVDNYRAAHSISLASGNNEASTEDLRQAMVHYRALFGELLAQEQPGMEERR